MGYAIYFYVPFYFYRLVQIIYSHFTFSLKASNQSAMSTPQSSLQNHMNSTLSETMAGLGNQRITGTSSGGIGNNSLETVVASSSVQMSTAPQQSIIQQLAGSAAATPVSQTTLTVSRPPQLNGQTTVKDVNVSLMHI